MWPFSKPKAPASVAPLFFTNTLTGTKDLFSPLKAGVVSMYSCGPTVYGPQHIGNLRAALFADVIARVLTQSGYHVRRVINITDVGHLVSDGDEGDDKMNVGALREKKTPAEIADKYTKQYLDDIRALNLDTDDILFPRATKYIENQIAMVKALEEKGLTYSTSEGVYFDTSKYPNYGKLGGIAEVKLMGGARIKMDGGKRNLHDFLLWRSARPHDLQKWSSPWGQGNPGWHIECSAMIRALLGSEIDIHTGGMDHIPVHHNNEIAQSESVNARPLARYWLHEAFITIEGEKISKSLNNTVLLSDITERGLHPLSLRYFYLQASFRTPVSFSWEAITASNAALHKLWSLSREVLEDAKGKVSASEKQRAVIALLRDDLATPSALALLWETLRDDEIPPAEKLGVLTSAEEVLGLSLLTPPNSIPAEIPEDIVALAHERDAARESKDYARSDELRIHIQDRGYRVDDGPSGTVVTPSSH
jgi:cysteinyl-tRNA synthetase